MSVSIVYHVNYGSKLRTPLRQNGKHFWAREAIEYHASR